MADGAPKKHPTASGSVVVIGASAGGPRALQTILPGLPPSFPAPVVVVQHFARELFDSWMQTLSRRCHLAVEAAADGRALAVGTITVCPPDHQYTLHRSQGGLRGRLAPDTTSTYRPRIDTTLGSAADACGAGAIGVILTGIGDDGVQGLARIVAAGGLTIAESEATAAVYGMPKAAAAAGVAQRVLPLHQVASELILALRLRESAEAASLPHGPELDPSLRALDADDLARRRDRAAVAELVRRLTSDEPIVIETAKAALQELPGRLVLTELVPLLWADRPVVRATAVDVAKRVSVEEPATIALLGELCSDQDDDVRIFGVDIASAHHLPELLDVLLARCDDPNLNVALMALKALAGYTAPRAVERLVAALDAEPAQRATAITALGRSPAPQATGHLASLELGAFEDQYLWLHAIGFRHDAASVAALLDRLDGFPRGLAPHALSALAELLVQTRDQLPPSELARARGLPFRRYLDDERAPIRADAMRILGVVGDDRLLTLLLERLDDLTREERGLALNSVAEMSGEAADTVLGILMASDDEEAVAEALDYLRSL